MEASHGRGLMDSGRIAVESMWESQQVWPKISAYSYSAILEIVWESYQQLALFLGFFSASNCAIAYMHAFLSFNKLLTIALMNNGEGSEDVDLIVSKILQHLAIRV